MKAFILYSIILVVFYSASFSQGKYYKVQLHCHTNQSDGRWKIRQLLEYYKSQNYDVVAITDHYTMTRTDTIQIPGLLTIHSQELTNNQTKDIRWHMNGIGLQKKIYDMISPQEMIDSISMQGALTILNHPTYRSYWNSQKIMSLTGFFLLEVLNYGRYALENYTYTKPFAIWDELLTAEKRLYGVGTDDFHLYDTANVYDSPGYLYMPGKLATMVYAEALSQEAILTSLREGNFYFTQGPLIDKYYADGDTLFVQTPNGSQIDFIGKNGELLETVFSNNAAYTVKGDEIYVRVEVAESDNQRAFLQARFLDNLSSNSSLAKILKFKVFPNPAESFINLTLNDSGSEYRIRIWNEIGKLVYYNEIRNVENLSFQIPIENFGNGIHLVKVNTKYKEYFSKFVKK